MYLTGTFENGKRFSAQRCAGRNNEALSYDFPDAKEIFWFACKVEPEQKEEAFTDLVKCAADEYGSIGCVYPEGQKRIHADRSAPGYRDTDLEEIVQIMSANPR